MPRREKTSFGADDMRAIEFAEAVMPHLVQLVGEVKGVRGKVPRDARYVRRRLRSTLDDILNGRTVADRGVVQEIAQIVAPWPGLACAGDGKSSSLPSGLARMS